MVRIIEQAACKQTECLTCKCKLEYDYTDIRFHLLCEVGKQASIKCAYCKNWTYVPVTF